MAVSTAFAAQPLHAQDVAPAAPPPAALVSSPVPLAAPAPADLGVDLFYAARNQAPLWLNDEAGRAAAAKLAPLLRNAALDGLANGPGLATEVDAAIARGQPADDKIISAAWVQYVRTLKGPVAGVSFGDPALKPVAPTAPAVLSEAARAASLATYVDAVAAVNPLYSALRDAAVKQGRTDDPHVRATLQRLRLIPATGRAVVVDAASAQLWMIEDGKPIDSMKVVVGKTTSPTPLLAGTIHYVTFNPYWHILDEVALRKVAPVVIKRGVSYLKAARYEVVGDWNSESPPVDPKTVDWKGVAAGTATVHIRQLPGANNMMGAVKFWFENDFGIYLHDTPHKELFAKPKRNFSLGCVRLEHAGRLAQWLFGRDASPPGGTPEQHVQLDKGVPVFITYLTANVADGQLAFADDVYGLDRPPEALAATAPPTTGAAAAAH
ncbi:MAG: L,D-transpeptidase YcbB [Sphingomonadales bacterium]|nr:L,D-transpeptidase YcbB [Sphingomonadales bacterium]